MPDVVTAFLKNALLEVQEYLRMLGQVGRALVAPGHTMPHIPQFDVSVAVSTHEPLQSVVPAGHPIWHEPSVHTMAPVHDLPHMPQFA